MILRAIELATQANAGQYNPAVLFRERADGGPGGHCFRVLRWEVQNVFPMQEQDYAGIGL